MLCNYGHVPEGISSFMRDKIILVLILKFFIFSFLKNKVLQKNYGVAFMHSEYVTFVYNTQTNNNNFIFLGKNVNFLNVPKMGMLTATDIYKKRACFNRISVRHKLECAHVCL